MSIPESIATTIDCNLSVRKYSKIAKRSNKPGRKNFWSHSKISAYKHKHCTPKNIRTPTEHSIEVDLQDVLNHQAFKLLTPEIKLKMLKLKSMGATFMLYFKYGNL